MAADGDGRRFSSGAGLDDMDLLARTIDALPETGQLRVPEFGRIRERIGRPEARSRGLARHYDITVDTGPTGQHAIAVRFLRRPLWGLMVTHPGAYRLRINRTDRDGAAPWRTRITPTDIGAVLRSPNPNPACVPFYRRKSVRAEGHLSVTVIARQLVQVIRTRPRAAGHGDGWAALRRILEGQRRVTAIVRRDDGRTLHVRKAIRPEAPETAIHGVSGIDHAPGETRKTVVRTGPKRTESSAT